MKIEEYTHVYVYAYAHLLECIVSYHSQSKEEAEMSIRYTAASTRILVIPLFAIVVFLCTLTKPTVVFSAIRYEIGSLTWCATHSDVPTIMECIFLGNNKATTPNNDIGKAFYSTNPYQELGRVGQYNTTHFSMHDFCEIFSL